MKRVLICRVVHKKATHLKLRNNHKYQLSYKNSGFVSYTIAIVIIFSPGNFCNTVLKKLTFSLFFRGCLYCLLTSTFF